jgi:type IV secretion system protein VirB8
MTSKLKIPTRKPQDFFTAAKQFESEKIDEIKKSRALAWKVAAGIGILAGLSIISQIAMVATRKDPEPWLIQVDSATGVAAIRKNVKDAQSKYDEVVNKYWLKQYVQTRENYDWFTAAADYNTVLLMSESPVGTEYANAAIAKDSPVETLKDKYKLTAKVTSISFIGDVAQVRFTRTKMSASGEISSTEPPTNWIATVAFGFSNTKMTDDQRLVNPLDFRVSSYRIDPEKVN